MVLLEEAFDCGPDSDNPGWHHWDLKDPTLFNGVVLGRLIRRTEGTDTVRLRMFPERKHTNIQGIIHGAVTLALIDIAMFAAMHSIGNGADGPCVTLELSTQFVGAGDQSRPLDAVTEIIRETRSMVFLRGTVEQDDDRVAAFSGIVRKMRRQ